MKKLTTLTFLLLLTACNEYWWTRGQPPSVKDLLQRANIRFTESSDSQLRSDFLPQAQKLKDLLVNSVDQHGKNEQDTLNALKSVESEFIALEGKISIGSRAAYGELSNQMRSFIEIQESKKDFDSSAYTLFASRSIMFLANELKVPAPTY